MRQVLERWPGNWANTRKFTAREKTVEDWIKYVYEGMGCQILLAGKILRKNNITYSRS